MVDCAGVRSVLPSVAVGEGGVGHGFIDISRLDKNGDRIRNAQEFVNNVSRIARAELMLTWVSDTGRSRTPRITTSAADS